MNLADGEHSIACYPAAAPAGRGVQATLTSHRLVLSNGAQEEYYPLHRIGGVVCSFERAARAMFWSAILLALAVGVGAGIVWAQANLPALANSMVTTLADSENPDRIAAAQRAYQQRVDLLMLLLLPLWGVAGALVLHAAWLLYTGIRGTTRVQITLPAQTRTLQRRGRDTPLLEFGESVARLAAGLKSAVPTSAEPAGGNFVDWIPTRSAHH